MEQNQAPRKKVDFWNYCPRCHGTKDEPQDVLERDFIGNEWATDCTHHFHQMKPYYESDL